MRETRLNVKTRLICREGCFGGIRDPEPGVLDDFKNHGMGTTTSIACIGLLGIAMAGCRILGRGCLRWVLMNFLSGERGMDYKGAEKLWDKGFGS